MASAPNLDPVIVSPYHPGARRAAPRINVWPRRRLWALALRLVTIGLLAGLVVRFGMFWASPLQRAYQSGAVRVRLEQEVQAVQSRQQRLRDDIAYLQTSEGIEQAARQLGWVFPGEVPVRADRTPNEVGPAVAPTGRALAATSTSERIQEFINVCLAAMRR